MDDKTILGLISALAALIGLVPYLVSILRGRTKPHLFTWGVWTLLMIMLFFIRLDANAGPGVWSTGVTAITCVIISALSLKYGEKSGNLTDWLALFFSLGAVPFWLCTENPTWSAILVTAIDVLAFVPTMTKTFAKPYSEDLFYYWTWLITYPASLFAVREVNIATTLYPAVWSAMGVFFVGGTLIRRAALKRGASLGSNS